MSHEIYENDNCQYGSNTPAWHSLGTVWPGLLTSLRCWIEGTGARTMVEEKVLTASGVPVEGYKSIVATYANGNTTALSVVGEDYGLMTDERFFTVLEGVYGGRAVVETAGTLRNGRRIWTLVKRDGWAIAGDKVNQYDLWVNRHDGSGCFELHRTNVRVVCQNTWNAAIGKGRNRVFGVRHTVNVEQNIASAIAMVEALDKSVAVEQAKAAKLAQIEMTREDAAIAFRSITKVDANAKFDDLPAKTRTQLGALNALFVRGTGNTGSTRWDAFNAVTEYVDHAQIGRAHV